MLIEQQPGKSRESQDFSGLSTTAADGVSTFARCGGSEVWFDDLRLDAIDAQNSPISARIVSTRSGGNELSPDMPPGRNFAPPGCYPAITLPHDKFEMSHGQHER